MSINGSGKLVACIVGKAISTGSAGILYWWNADISVRRSTKEGPSLVPYAERLHS